MRIPFTLDAWLKDKSQKVETTFGEEAKIVFTEGLGKRPILAVIYDGDTTDTAWFTEDGKSSDGVDGLFIVTPEPEISEFEKCVKHLMEETLEAGDTHNLKPDSEMLLRMAKQQLLQSGELLTQEHHAKLMETLNKAHEEELEKAYKNADEVQYRKGREDALKDLPRWRNVEADKTYVGCVARYMDVNGDWNYCMSSGKLSDDCQYISIAALEKLPQEDESHE